MKQVKYNFKSANKRLLLELARQLDKDATIHDTELRFRSVVNSYSSLNRNEKALLFRTTMDLYRKGRVFSKRTNGQWQKFLARNDTYALLNGATRKVQMTAVLRYKRISTKLYLSSANIIFFLCSTHGDPAEDHKEYQGKVYVDRFWRQKVSGSDYYKVASYIKNHNIKTVQYIMGAPVWLTTRPYCKHYLIPLQTSAVLTSSANKLRKQVEQPTTTKTYTIDTYYTQRDQAHQYLYSFFPCDEFRVK